MRFPIAIAALSVVACSSGEVAAPALPNGTYAGAGRDALCVAGNPAIQRGGFIAYGANDTNCSARGTITRQGGKWTLTPDGDADCRIPILASSGRVALGPGTTACAYYCGPDAGFAGRSFARQGPTGQRVTDLSGDPLC